MNQCLWCGKTEMPRVRLADLINWFPIKKEPLCLDCQANCFELQSVSTCKGCGRKWEKELLCEDCIRWQQLYPGYSFHNEALYEYNGFMKEWMERYKFKGDFRFREVFAVPLKERLVVQIKQGWKIVPIPISQNNLSVRGFNQVIGMLDFAQVPYVELLDHIGTGAKQSTKDRKQRMTSPQPFSLLSGQKEFVDKRKILLIDDVYTTGRTLFHAAECLFANGAAEVQTLTIAR